MRFCLALLLTLLSFLSRFFSGAITNPYTPEQLRTGEPGNELIHLTDHLALNCTNPAIVNALLYVTGSFGCHS